MTNGSNEFTKLVPVVAAGPPVTVTMPNITNDATFNKGFLDGVRLMNPYYVELGADDAYFKCTACIPLKLISDFFQTV